MPDKNTYKTFNRQEKNRKLENQRLIDFEYKRPFKLKLHIKFS